MDKTAVDKTCRDYWTNYFKEYGSIWTRDIPRRIKQAVRRTFKADKAEGQIIPLAHEIAQDGTLSLEAAFVGQLNDDQNARILITAEFDTSGKMKSIDFTRIN